VGAGLSLSSFGRYERACSSCACFGGA
jgi:hypothetical protein